MASTPQELGLKEIVADQRIQDEFKDEKAVTANTILTLLNDNWLKDIAVQLALDDVNGSEIINHINKIFQAKLNEAEKGFQVELKDLDQEIDSSKSKLDELKTHLNKEHDAIDKLLNERETLRKELEQIATTKAVIRQTINEKRVKSEKKFFADESAQLASEADQTYQGIIQDIDQRVKVAGKLYEAEQIRWEANKPEYERIAEDFLLEKGRIEEEQKEINERLKSMRYFGVTKTTAGFLIWAGYFSLAAISTVVGLLIASPQKKSIGSSLISDHMKEVINMVISGVGNLVHGEFKLLIVKDYALKVGLFIGTVFCILIVVTLITLLMDRLLNKFDVSWGKKPRKPLKKSDSATSGKLTDLLFPSLNRELYKNVLAAIPVIVIATVIVIFLSLVGVEPIPTSASNGAVAFKVKDAWADGLTSTYYGMAITLLAISGALLYAQRFIEPRWLKYLDNNHPPNLNKKLAGHQEFLIITGLLLVALLACAVLPSGHALDRVSLFAVALFMCAMSLGLAYGLIYRGLFREGDHLEGKRQGYRNLIDEYSAIPTYMDFYDDAIPSEEGGFVKEYRKSRHKLNEMRMLNELRWNFSDDNLDSWRLLKPLRSKGFWSYPSWSMNHHFFPLLLRIVTKKKSNEAIPEITLKDSEAAPAEARYLAWHIEQERQLMGRHNEFLQAISDKKQEISKKEDVATSLVEEIESKESQKQVVSAKYEQVKAEHEANQEQTLLSFKAAHALGVFYRKLFLSDIPPGSPNYAEWGDSF